MKMKESEEERSGTFQRPELSDVMARTLAYAVSPERRVKQWLVLGQQNPPGLNAEARSVTATDAHTSPRSTRDEAR